MQGDGKMRRKHPRILGSLRNPLPLQTSPLCIFPASVHFIPTRPSSLHPALHVNPLSVFCSTSLPPLKNTVYFPTLMMAMPSSSCVAKLSSKHPALFQPSPHSSTLMATSPKQSLLESCLISLSHQEAGYPQLHWHILQELSRNSPDTEPEIGGDRWDSTALVPGKQHPQTQTGNHEEEKTQVLVNCGAFTQNLKCQC